MCRRSIIDLLHYSISLKCINHNRMKRIFYICFFIFLFSHFTLTAFSQQSTIQATIVDAKTGELLPGATIVVVGSPDNEATISDFDGKFLLKHTDNEGDKLRISFIGYKTLELPVASITSKTKIKLEPESKQIQEVSVTGYAEGQTKALMDQKNALNIKNVVSQEQIEQFPDMNAAETLQRIPGITLQSDKGEGRFVQLRGTPPEYTNFNVNGEQIPSPEGGVRYVGLDAISSDQIEFIEVNKVLTPDMDADGIGGTVNIVTKKAKSEIPEINASASGGYSNLRQTPNYQGQLSFAQRSGKIGFSVNGNFYKNESGADNMEFKYIKGPFWNTSSQDEGEDNYHIQYEEFQLRHYNINRTRKGLSSNLDYYINNNHKLYLRGMYNSFTDEETRRRVIYTLDDPVTETYYLYGGVERDLKYRTKNQSISSFNIGGEDIFGQFQLDYEASYSLATEDQPDRLEVDFDSPGSSMTMEFDLSDPDWPTLSLPDSSDAANAEDYDNYELDELLIETVNVTDKNIGGKINLKMDYTGLGGKGYIKFGGKVRFKEKERDVQAIVYTKYSQTVSTHTGSGPEYLLPELTDGFEDNNLLDHGYTVNWTPGVQETRDFYEYYPQLFYINKTDTKEKTYGEDFFAKEDIYAAYGMFSHNINKFMILGGLRYEFTNIYYEGNQLYKTSSGVFKSMSDSIDERSHHFLLPQFQVKYSINNSSNIRAAVTRSFSRPSFEDVLPYKKQDRDEIEVGNSDLEFPLATNIDLLAETYGNHGEMISAGLFFKDITNYVYNTRYRAAYPGGSAKYRATIPQNGKQAHVYGAEILTQFKFSFLPSFLSNFGLYLNYTYTHSDAKINKRIGYNKDQDLVYTIGESTVSDFDTLGFENITLPGQAAHSANIALFYEVKRLYLKLSANYQDEFLHTLGAQSDLDEYYAASFHLDFNANYNITDNIKLFVDAKNLTNVPLKYYLGKPENNRILKQEYYSWWFRMGLRLKLN